MIYIIDEKEVKLNHGITSIYFYASWMPFHKKQLLMIEKIEEKFPNITFFGVDVDKFKGLVARFEIKSVPTFIIYSEGRLKKQLNGYLLTSAFVSAYTKICGKKEKKND